jgi:hypothetical protein
MVPWIQIENTAGVVEVATSLKGMGGIFDRDGVCPVSVQPYSEYSCYPDFYDETAVRDEGKFYSSGVE